MPEIDPTVMWFVKPVRGAASFASFILDGPEDLRDLPMLQAQMRSDPKMSAIFMDQYDFLVEEYIEGPEFSFEAVVLGETYQVCVHEKAKMERQKRAMLEAMSISPPISIAADVVLAGARFVSACLAALGLDAGAFHVEAKYWTTRQRWEIIEINPRMGGSLINASVKAVTGSSMLELWLESLLAKSEAEASSLRQRLKEVSQLETLRQGRISKATVFLSKYGTKGRTIESIEFSPPERPPAILKMHAERGTELENSDRALCLMDALWQVDYMNLGKEVEFLDRLANEHFRVAYQ
jgi:biotin carboxylase